MRANLRFVTLIVAAALATAAGCAAEEAICGDGVMDVGVEECDDGNNFDGDGCSSDCLIELNSYCGDGLVDVQYEECDDGNLLDGDGCSRDCLLEVSYCGDGTRDPNEECDDGNLSNGDGCDSNCLFECDFDCNNGYCVYSGYACDGVNDCGNHADEAGCSPCTTNQFYCSADSQCIAFAQTCDATSDCSDGADEGCF